MWQRFSIPWQPLGVFLAWHLAPILPGPSDVEAIRAATRIPPEQPLATSSIVDSIVDRTMPGLAVGFFVPGEEERPRYWAVLSNGRREVLSGDGDTLFPALPAPRAQTAVESLTASMAFELGALDAWDSDRRALADCERYGEDVTVLCDNIFEHHAYQLFARTLLAGEPLCAMALWDVEHGATPYLTQACINAAGQLEDVRTRVASDLAALGLPPAEVLYGCAPDACTVAGTTESPRQWGPDRTPSLRHGSTLDRARRRPPPARRWHAGAPSDSRARAPDRPACPSAGAAGSWPEGG